MELVPVYLVVSADYFATSMMRTVLPQVAMQQGWSATAVGSIESIYGAGQLVGAPFLGRLSDKYGRRRIMAFSCAGAALGHSIFASEAFGRASLLASRVPVGLAKQTVTVSRAMVSDQSDGVQRTIGMSRLGAAMGFGYCLGPIVGGLLADAFGPDAPATLVACLFICLFVTCRALRETEESAKINKPDKATASMTSWRCAPRLLCFLAAFLLSEFALAAWTSAVLPPLAKKRLGGSFTSLGYFNSLLAALVTVSSAVLLPLLCQCFSAEVLIIFGNITFAIAAILLCIKESTVFMIIGTIPFALGISTMRSLPAAVASQLAPAAAQGEVMGLLDLASSFCRAIAPALFGLVIDSLGFSVVLPLLAMLCLAACAVMLIWFTPGPSGEVAQKRD